MTDAMACGAGRAGSSPGLHHTPEPDAKERQEVLVRVQSMISIELIVRRNDPELG